MQTAMLWLSSSGSAGGSSGLPLEGVDLDERRGVYAEYDGRVHLIGACGEPTELPAGLVFEVE